MYNKFSIKKKYTLKIYIHPTLGCSNSYFIEWTGSCRAHKKAKQNKIANDVEIFLILLFCIS